MALGKTARIPIVSGVDAVADFREEGQLRYVRTTDIVGLTALRSDQAMGVPRSQAADALLEHGDIVMTRSGSLGTSYLHDSAETMAFAGYLVRYRPRLTVVNPRFAAWWTQSRDHLDQVSLGAVRSTIDNFSAKKFTLMSLPVPPLKLQAAIAAYLDVETAKIDALIAKQSALVASLRARRRAVIRHAVLGRNRPLFKKVEANTPWVPELPSTWAFSPLGYRYEVVLGKMLDAGRAPREGDVDLPYIRAANIQETGLDLSSVNSMPFNPMEAVKFSLRAEDLLVVEGGSVGVSLVLAEDVKGWAFQKTVNRVRSRGDSSTRYLHYVLNAYRNVGVFGIVCGGSTIAHLTAEKLSALRIPVPPLQEQQEIAECLDRETARIDALIDKSERMIKLSQERRAALITAAVTGQIDVAEMESGEEAA